MEQVLYDVYLAEAEIKTNYDVFSSDSARKQELLNSVLKKHKISEAVLDTSLAWYSGRLEKYFKINDRLSKQFAKEAEIFKQKEEIEKKSIISADNNGILLPVEKERFLLKSSDLLNNVYTFNVDTTLNSKGGAYRLQFNILGITTLLRPVVTLCVQCSDTTFVKRDTISRNGLFVSSIDINQEKSAKKLYGSIYFPEVYSGTTVFIHDFTLTHNNHVIEENNLENDSIQNIKSQKISTELKRAM